MQQLRSDSPTAQYAAERLELNLARLRIVAVVAFVVHLAHVCLFQLSAPAAEPLHVAQWRTLITLGHAALFAFSGVLALGSFAPRRVPRLATHLPTLFTFAYGLLGAWLTAVDQLITTDTTPFTICIIGVAVLATLETPERLGALALSLGAYLVGQAVMIPSRELFLSNAVKGISVSIVSLLISTLFARHHREGFDHRQVIEYQRRKLEEALAEAKAAAERVRAESEAKSRFLALMSHEIRTPMTGLLGVAEVLSTTDLDAQQRESVTTLQECGLTLVALITDLLDMSKAEAGRLTISSAPFDLEQELRSLERLFHPRAQQQGLALEVAWDGAPAPLLLGDGLRIRQVLGNLVNNALKFTSRGEIRVVARARREGERWALRVDVTDTGPGISAEVLARLFKPWEQADERTTRMYGGTGLGLAISRQLAEAMGGRLDARSTPGEGSTFTLELALDAAAPTIVAEVAPQPQGRLQGRVLVVDDNPVNQRVAKGMLARLGLEVELAGDGACAEELLQVRPFDAVVTDLHMPLVDGLALLEWVRRQDGALRTLPVIVLTADVLPEERERCVAAGANAVVTKPFRLAEFEVCLREHGKLRAA